MKLMSITSFGYVLTRGQAEREFKVEVEAIGRVRHKHLVRLLGYCMEGEYRLLACLQTCCILRILCRLIEFYAFSRNLEILMSVIFVVRMLVYEYVENGNLDQWLHGDVGEVSPLTWEIRMTIILGTAKGYWHHSPFADKYDFLCLTFDMCSLAYLHEGLEPKVVHRDVKASNILLDRHWNPKISDFGLAKHLGSERTYVTTRVMGTFGSVTLLSASVLFYSYLSAIVSHALMLLSCFLVAAT